MRIGLYSHHSKPSLEHLTEGEKCHFVSGIRKIVTSGVLESQDLIRTVPLNGDVIWCVWTFGTLQKCKISHVEIVSLFLNKDENYFVRVA